MGSQGIHREGLRRGPPRPKSADLAPRAISAPRLDRPARSSRVRALRALHAAGPSLAPSRLMTKNRWVSIAVVGAVSLALGLGCASKEANQPAQVEQLTRAISAPDRPGPPEPLSPAARALLKERMASHAEDMSDLVSGIMLLEYSRIITRADKI